MTSAHAFAPAKVNLALHVTGRMDDGYHVLDSLVAFADVGDHLHVSPGTTLSLRVTGPRAEGVPTGPENLVMKAAALFGADLGAEITLEKHLPNAAGIGGGSADAAAALRVLSSLWDRPLPDHAKVVTLGADVPVCLASRPARMRGIGDVLDPVPAFPPAWIVLANPGVTVPTRAVFSALATVDGAPLSPPDWHDFASFIGWLCHQRNDLAAPARAHTPLIDTVIHALDARSGCALARMSGSGATCFGLFENGESAGEAAMRLATMNPAWWVAVAPLFQDRPPAERIS